MGSKWPELLFFLNQLPVTSELVWSSEKLADHLGETLNAPENLFTEATQKHASESQVEVNCKWCEKCQEWSSISPGLWFPATRNTRDRSSHAHWPEVRCARVWLSMRGRGNPASLHHQHSTPEFLHKVLFAVIHSSSGDTTDWLKCIISVLNVYIMYRSNACSLYILIIICNPPLLWCIHVCLYGCTCVCMDSFI